MKRTMIRNELSILLPVYNTRCLTMVERLKELCDAVDGLRYEIIAADDGSTDRDAVAFNRGTGAQPQHAIFWPA